MDLYSDVEPFLLTDVDLPAGLLERESITP
jgi:hypothetical protein